MRFSIVRGRARLPERFEDFEDYVRTRLDFALDRFRARLVAIVVRLDDLNGPRGGTDQLCRIRVRLDGSHEIVVEARSTSIEEAVDRAADRIRRAVSRAVERLRFRTERRGPHHGASGSRRVA